MRVRGGWDRSWGEINTIHMDTNIPNSSLGDRGKTVPTSLTSQEKAGAIPRFLVVKKIDEGNFDKVSPFVISKCLYGVVGNLRNIKKIKDGLLVETVSEIQAKRLLKVEKLGAYNVLVEPHRSLNQSKGVVFCPDFLNCTVEEIAKEMESEGVTSVKRIQKRVNGNLVDTANHILTFNRPKVPAKVKAAFYSLDVRQYIPNPLRCFNCQKFGHVTTSCQEEKICACGKLPHTGEPCKDPVICVNCGGSHSAKSRTCPRMIEETNIQRVRVLENLSYGDARKKVCGPRRTSRPTYAEATTSDNSKIILQELMPNIAKIIEDQISNALNVLINQPSASKQQYDTSLQKINMGPPVVSASKDRGLIKSGSVSDASQITLSELKRKRDEEKTTQNESLDSDDSVLPSEASDTSKKGKKRKGWPKGKTRKPQGSSGSLMPESYSSQYSQPPD